MTLTVLFNQPQPYPVPSPGTLLNFALGALGLEQNLSANDAQIAHSAQNVAKDVRLAGGALKRYKVLVINKWQLAYSWLPGKRRDVYDGGQARDDLYALYGTDNPLSFLVSADTGEQLAYTVRFSVNSWRNERVFVAGDFDAYRIGFELVQVK